MITNTNGKMLGSKSSSLQIKRIATKVVSLLQDYHRGDIVVVFAVLWLMLCKRYNVRPIDTLPTAERLLNETVDDQLTPQFKALEEYIRDEL